MYSEAGRSGGLIFMPLCRLQLEESFVNLTANILSDADCLKNDLLTKRPLI